MESIRTMYREKKNEENIRPKLAAMRMVEVCLNVCLCFWHLCLAL